jgi:hypothetical protein
MNVVSYEVSIKNPESKTWPFGQMAGTAAFGKKRL